MTNVTVVEMNPQTDARWEQFVIEHPRSTVFHHPAWLRILNTEYPQRSVHLACIGGGGEVLGILPLVHTRGFPVLGGPTIGRRLSSLPRTPVAGPLTTEPGATSALLREAVARVKAEPGLRLQVKVRQPGEKPGDLPVQASFWRVNYVLELPKGQDAVRFGDSRNHARIKWAVKKSRKLGVAVREADRVEELEIWYRLYVETMRAHVVPPRPFRLFEAMWETLRERGMMRLLLAYKENRGIRPTILAGSILLMWGDTVFYAFNGRHRDHLWMRPNDVLQWEAVHQAAADGFHYYDLGEVAANNPGLADFKKKWGARSHALYRYHYPPVQPSVVSTSGPARFGRELVDFAWRRLPHPVTTAVGEQVYKYL